MLKAGQPISKENLIKIDSLKKSIYTLLLDNGMTTKELVDSLLGIPDGVTLRDLNLITIALNDLVDHPDIIRVSFKTNKETVEAVFRSLGRYTYRAAPGLRL